MARPWSTFVAAVFVAAILSAAPAAGQDQSPAGTWRTIDDKTGQAKAIVAIASVNGELQGTIEKIFVPPAPEENPLCTRCADQRRNKPVVGMQILWGLKRHGSEYTGGWVLNPEDGKTYRAKLRLVDGGRKLEVRGFVGLSLFGRTQTWIRQ